jgi:N-acetylneuraminate synthase/sialic acid synthase
MLKMGKKLVATRDLPAGHRLSAEDISIKSPGDGLPPSELQHLVGRLLNVAIQEDEAFTLVMLDGVVRGSSPRARSTALG